MGTEQNKDFPLVSIFAICHNHAKYVVETLDSIKNQTYSEIQLIIIDNCSTDKSDEIIDKWIIDNQYNCEFIRNPEPYLLAKNCNQGLNHVKGLYFQGISCDDILVKEKIAKQVKMFEVLEDNVACNYSDMAYINEKSIVTGYTHFSSKTKNNVLPTGDLRNELSRMCFIPAPSILLKTQAVKNIGGYDEKYEIEDWPLFLKLSQLGYQFYPSNESLVYYRVLTSGLNKVRSQSRLKKLLQLFSDYKSFLIADEYSIKKWLSFVIEVSKYDFGFGYYKYLEVNKWSGKSNLSYVLPRLVKTLLLSKTTN